MTINFIEGKRACLQHVTHTKVLLDQHVDVWGFPYKSPRVKLASRVNVAPEMIGDARVPCDARVTLASYVFMQCEMN